ncbi:50S ribosomal protein L21 [Aureimonas leprariae]|uniref:Large ribosomal subunit protein bL21 n=1 Tax=Plantimonas leprariae TaxID=2615207 RepID=A0A7V7PRC9_9HYPH|nr:50S ribosomal protein L21 [Aureimonas leprariae]KAB0681303.1 50S ribosomal protein L21 [Aureimonas leprariae]
MFAVIKTGGKQYRVAANDEFTVERLPGAAGDRVTFAEVLMVDATVGAPFVSGASVVAEIVEQTRGPKVISFKKRRRQNSKRTRGHRQDLTLIRIGEILTDGRQPSEAAADPATAEEKPKRASRAAKAETAEPSVAETAEAPVAGATSEPTTAAETADAPAKPKAARKPKAEKAAKE